MFKKTQELREKYEEGQNVQQQHEDETVLALSGLAIYVGNRCRNVQEKAQAEIDRVVGSGRLPTFEDQPDLPFLNAVILETLRWNPVASFGVPHVSRHDDVYEGYFIPKGTSVMANLWGFSRNSKYYTNPSIFDPGRYLKQPPELDPREFVFGFGGRICPGKDLAFQDIWILAASVLWAFELLGVEGEAAQLADEDRFLFGFIK
ncbi:hypothetical protein FRC01_004377 [Tulasnella sp. 417]|nr:hypothetical protein FRC01_004377 [Tulasnella sp. 417]